MWPFKKKEEKPPAPVEKVVAQEVTLSQRAAERSRAPVNIQLLTAKVKEEPRSISEREAQLLAQALKVYMRGEDEE